MVMEKKFSGIIVMFFIIFCSVFSDYSKNYGPFNLAITNYETCKGPKRKSCAESDVKVITRRSLRFNITVTEEMSIIQLKLNGLLNNKEVMKWQWKNVCEERFARPIVQAFLKVTDQCRLLKCHATFNIDIEKISRTFYGGIMMYGNWTIKMLFYNNNCQMHCGTLYFLVTPHRQ